MKRLKSYEGQPISKETIAEAKPMARRQKYLAK